MSATKSNPGWNSVKTRLKDFDRAGLLALVQDMYAANKDNRTFLHTRLSLGDDALKPFKATICRWLWPDLSGRQATSVAQAKKAIADYKKALGEPEGLAELMVFYCEQAAGFSNDVGLQDEGYFDALERMFEQALKAIAVLAPAQRQEAWARLDAVRRISKNFGYGVVDTMGDLLAEYRGDG